jgi:hypothetical protein
MLQTHRRFELRSLTALAGALVWGVVEVIALARSRWSHGQRR